MKEKNTNNKKLTPAMKQYWDTKKSYPDSIMLFRMGDFYETFDEDAKITSKVLGITLTKRANGAASSVPLAGFPYHAYNQYVHKLLEAGYKVALCEQVEDPKVAKGIVKREVVELLTPGTTINNEFLNSQQNNYLGSVYLENNNMGFAIIDNSTAELLCGETKVNNLNDILSQYQIKELIIPESQKKTVSCILKNKIMITTYEDWKTDRVSSYAALLKQFKTKSLKGFGIEDNFLTIVAASACVNYIDNNSFGKTNHINSIYKIEEDKFMHMDSFTVKNLEIFESLSDNPEATLFHIVNNTLTSAGSRLLRNHLLKPLRNIKEINFRLLAVEELIENNYEFDKIRNVLSNISDIERIIVKISSDKANPRDVVNLGNSLRAVNNIKRIFNSKMKNNKYNFKNVYDLSELVNTILKTIKEDPSINFLKGGYVKDGFNKELDSFRAISSKANNWLVEYQENQRKTHNIPSLKVSFNKVFGYYIDVTKTHIDKVPENYIRKQTLVNNERYFTVELKNYEEKILSSKDQIINLEKNIFNDLTNIILKLSKKIQSNAKLLSNLDVFCSNAITAIENNYSKPVVKNNTKYNLENSRHPVVEKLLDISDEFISNDLNLDTKNKQIAIITGPNMAGKSTYLRQIALNALLAQAGLYVAADYCKLGIVDKLFTRVGASDNLAGGESTFLVEMNETANILNNSTKNSLIILDEIGRGTSTFDGLSLAWAITEYIHNNDSCKARTLFATHYHELIYLGEKLNACFNMNIQVKEHKNEVIFLRKIKEGGASKSYGIHVAKLAGIPHAVINRAKHLLSDFMNDKKIVQKSIDKKSSLEDNQLLLFEKFESAIIEEIKKINLNNISPIEALNILNEIKKKYNI